MNVIKKTQHGTRFAVISQEAMDEIIAYEAHEAELAQRLAAPVAAPEGKQARGQRVKPMPFEEVSGEKVED